MPYIGRDLNRGNYLKLDDISSSFNGNTQTFNLTVGGSAFTPGSAFSILVSLGGVIQEPESAYQVENSEITFANAPTAQDSFFCIALGVALGIGVPGNGTVNGAHLAKPFNYDGYFYLDDTNNRVGIGSLAPTSTLDVRGDAKISGILTATSYSGPISNPSGISTFYDLRVSNNLIVEGTTTTLDTNVTGVDRIEINANSNTDTAIVGIQSGTADIVNLYDGTTKVLTVKDGGNVGIKTGTADYPLDVNGITRLREQVYVNGNFLELNNSGDSQYTLNKGGTQLFSIRNNSTAGVHINTQNSALLCLGVSTGSNNGTVESTLSINYQGRVGINDQYPDGALDVNGQTHLDDVSISGITTMGGDLIIENTYPRIYLRDTNHNPDFSIINNDGNLGFRDDTNGKYRLTIHSNGKVGVNSTAPSQQFTSYADSGYPILANGPSNAIGLSVNGAIVFGTKDLGSYGSGILDASYLEFKINGSPKLTIMPGGGAIGIHTTTGTNTVSIGGAEGLGVKFHNFTSGNSTFVTVQPGDMFATNIGGTGYATWHTQGNEKMRLANNGRLGIGTTNPQTLLHLSSSNPIIRLTDTDNNAYSAIGGESGFLYLYTNSTARDFIFRGTTEVARLTGDGKLGIGTNNPGRPLTITAADARIRLQDSDTGGHAEIYTDNSHNLQFSADSSSSSGSSQFFFRVNGTEKVRIQEDGDIIYGPGDHIIGGDPAVVNGLGSHNNANVSSIIYGINDGGGTNGMRVENFDDGTYNSQRIKFLTGKGGYSMATVRMSINENGYIGIGTDAATNGAKLEINSGTETNASNQYDGQNFSLVIRANKGHAANGEGNGICFAQKFSGGSDSIIRTGAIIGIKDSANGSYGGGLLFKTQANGANAMVDALRITSAGNVGINESTNISARLHVQHDALSEKILHATRYNDQANDKPIFAVTETQMTGMTSSGLIIGNHNRDIHIGQVFDSSGNMDGSNNIGLRIRYEGQTELYPKVGNNANTQFTFTNSASTPYIQVKTNNVADGAAIYFGEDNSGAHIKFLTKRRSGAQNSGSLLSILDLDPYGRVLTADAGGNLKTYPLVSGASIGSSGAEIGQFNYHDMRAPNAELGGWVLLGVDYHGAHPYPRKAYKITKHENGAQGTRVYQIWHDGDANYHYGGMWELRVNEWGSTSNKHESVHFRCVNGRRNDVSVLVQPDGNGLWLMPHTIWGRFFIRRAGWDDNMRTRGSDYCAVTNGAALASGTVQTGVGGSIPGYDYASGNPNPTYHEVFPFDGAGGSHTGGYYIEQGTTSAG